MAKAKSEIDSFSHLSDEELRKIADSDKSPVSANDFSHMSTEELTKIANKGKNLPGNLEALDNNGFDPTGMLKEYGQGIVQGGVDTAQSVANLGKRGLDAAAGAKFDPIDIGVPTEGRHPISFQLGKATELGGELLIAPEIKAAQQLVAKIVPYLEKNHPKVLEQITKNLTKNKKTRVAQYIPEAADLAATGAAYGTLFGANNPEQSLQKSALKGALEATGVGAVARVPSAFREVDMRDLWKKIKNREVKGRSPKEVAALEDVHGNLPIDIGTATNNDTRFQKYKDLGIGSGVKKNVEKISATTDDHANSLVESLIGKDETKASTLDTNDLAKTTLLENYDRNKKKVSDIYKDVSERAVKEDIHPERTEVKKVLNEQLSLYENKAKKGTLTDTEEGTEKIFKGILSKIDSATEQPLLHDLDEYRKDLGKEVRKHSRDENRYLVSLYHKLEDATVFDMEKAIEKSKDPALKERMAEAKRLHIDTVLPYREGSLEDIMFGKKHNEKLHNELVKAAHDKVFKELPDNLQKQIIYRFMNTTGKDIKPAELAAQYRKLDEGTKKRLLGDATKEWDKLVKLNDIKQKINPVLNKPDTGVKAKDWIVKLAIPILGAVGGNQALHSNLGLYGGATLGALASATSNRRKANYETSPKTREAYIKQESKPSKETEMASKFLRMLLAAEQGGSD